STVSPTSAFARCPMMASKTITIRINEAVGIFIALFFTTEPEQNKPKSAQTAFRRCAIGRGRKCLAESKVSAIKHTYEVHPRSDKRGVDLISDALPFGRL